MDRWASNTARTLGIVLASILLIFGSLLLGLLSLCSYGGMFGSTNKSYGTLFLVGLVVFVALGGVVITILAKGIVRESSLPPSGPAAADASPPSSNTGTRASEEALPHLSPASQAAIYRLLYAMAAQIGIGALSWLWALRYVLSARQSPLGMWAPVVSGIAADLPYLAIAYRLLRSPGRRTFAYALAVPGILIFYGCFGSSAAIFYLARMHQPVYSLALLLPWALHILIFYLAWKAIRQIGIHPDHGSLLVAALVTFLYFSFLPFLTAALYMVPRWLHG